MRIAIVINSDRVLNTPKFSSRRLTLLGEKTIFVYDIRDIEDQSGFARLKSFVGTMIKNGLKAVLVCQPWVDGNERFRDARVRVGEWLDYLTSTGIFCVQRTYDPTCCAKAAEAALMTIDDFKVKYSKTLEEMMDSARFLTTTETAAILSEHYREIRPRDVRRLRGLPHERSGQRRLGYRESEVATFIKDNT
jgi:hypothetical protein